jgi:integrase
VLHLSVIGNRQDLLSQIVKARFPKPRTTIAEPNDIDKLLAVAPRWMKTIILLAADAALRRSDCKRVAPTHYDSEKRVLQIDQQKTGNPVCIPVTDRLKAILDSAPTGSPLTPFYALWREKPISDSGLARSSHQKWGRDELGVRTRDFSLGSVGGDAFCG